MRNIKDINNCEHGNCNKKAVSIVYSRNLEKVVACCEECEDKVIDEQDPEYWDRCPNCNCRQGIN